MEKPLNEILKTAISGEWGEIYTDFGINKYFPRIKYDLQGEILISGRQTIVSLSKIIFNLASEVNDHTRAENRRVKSSLQGKNVLVELAWDGEPLSQDVIDEVNSRYLGEPGYSGSRLAGDFARELGGEIKIENFSDDLYTVRNIIRLPRDFKK